MAARTLDAPDDPMEAIEALEAEDSDEDACDDEEDDALDGIQATSRETASGDRFVRDAVLDAEVMTAERDDPWPFPKLIFAAPPPAPAPRPAAVPSAVRGAPRPSVHGTRRAPTASLPVTLPVRDAPRRGDGWWMPAFFASGLVAAAVALGLLVVGVGAVGLVKGRAPREVAVPATPAPVIAEPPVVVAVPEPVIVETPAPVEVAPEAPVVAAARPVRKKVAPVAVDAPPVEESPTLFDAPTAPPTPTVVEEEKKKGLFGRKREK
jgi:hypothetical protein